MGTIDIAQRLVALIGPWDGVDVSPARFGTVEFRVQRREIGHVHASGVADLPFPVRMRRDLVSGGRASPHRTLPHSGWVSFYIRTENDIPAAVELFRLNYDRLRGLDARGRDARSGLSPITGTITILGDHAADDLPA